MATAVQTSSEPRTPNPRTRLALASLAGAAFVIAGVAVAAYLIPQFWEQAIAPLLVPLGGFVSVALRIVAQIAAVGLFIWLGSKLAGANPPHGVRGGVFLALVGLAVIFFLVRAVGLALEDSPVGLPITVGVLVVLLFLFWRFLTSARAERWMTALEEQGWFHAHAYKRTQGLQARRYTMIGMLLVGWTGVYSLMIHESLGRGDWVLRLPFDLGTITPLTDLHYSGPFLLAVVVFWIAWRAVNMPTFADFLVATEAEMNKVSWPTRRRLFQDTIVVLVTCAILTAFLLVVDLFWGWLLSLPKIEILPARTGETQQVDPTQGRPAHW
jgi:preprotein translocase SecE subunit